MEIWELNVYCENGLAYSILGDGDVFKAELIAWQEYQRCKNQGAQEAQASFSSDRYIDTEGFEVRRVDGYFHNISQFPAVLGYRFNEVQGMTILRMK